MNDIEIIEYVKNGRTEKFAMIVERYQSFIFRTCMGFIHDEVESEDVTQDIFVIIFKNLNKFRGDSLFSTWIYRITVNECLRVVSKKKKSGFSISIDSLLSFGSNVSHGDAPDKVLIEDERRKAIQEAIDSLSENQRVAFVLSKYDDLSQKEIAQVLNTTEGAVESLLQRAKLNLQKKLVQYHKK
mgnify:CR=1 FL=1